MLKAESISFKDATKKLVVDLLKSHLSYVPEQFSSVENYMTGCIIVFDTKDAWELKDKSLLIQDGYPPLDAYLSLFDIFFESHLGSGDSLTSNELAEWFIEYSGQNEYFRFKDASKLSCVEDVLKIVRTFSFWMPEEIMLNGVWHDTYGQGAQDLEGNVVGVRF